MEKSSSRIIGDGNGTWNDDRMFHFRTGRDRGGNNSSTGSNNDSGGTECRDGSGR